MAEEKCKCKRCHRALKNPESQKVGYGPVCRVREAIARQKEHDDQKECRFAALNTKKETVCLHEDGPLNCPGEEKCEVR